MGVDGCSMCREMEGVYDIRVKKWLQGWVFVHVQAEMHNSLLFCIFFPVFDFCHGHMKTKFLSNTCPFFLSLSAE